MTRLRALAIVTGLAGICVALAALAQAQTPSTTCRRGRSGR